jgi:hypothetical protein
MYVCFVLLFAIAYISLVVSVYVCVLVLTCLFVIVCMSVVMCVHVCVLVTVFMLLNIYICGCVSMFVLCLRVRLMKDNVPLWQVFRSTQIYADKFSFNNLLHIRLSSLKLLYYFNTFYDKRRICVFSLVSVYNILLNVLKVMASQAK